MRFTAFLLTCGLLTAIERPCLEMIKEEAKSENDGAASGRAGESDATDGDVSVHASAVNVNVLREKSYKVYSLLTQALSLDLLKMIEEIPTGDAHGVWKFLTGRYERKSTVNQTQLLSSFFHLAMKSDETIDRYVARMKSLVLKIADAGEKLSETMKIHVLLSGLPREYDQLRQSLAWNKALGLDELIGYLVDHEEREKFSQKGKQVGSGSSGDPIDVANYAGPGDNRQHQHARPWNSNSSSGGGQNYRPQGSGGADRRSCFACNQPGHVMFDCPRNKDVIKCHVCRRIGHTAEQKDRCRGPPVPRPRWSGHGQGDRRQQGGAAPPPPSSSSGSGMLAAPKQELDENQYREDECFLWMACERPAMAEMKAALAATEVKEDIWVLDSGATHHLCKSAAMLNNDLRSVDAVKLSVADGREVVVSTGGECSLPTAAGSLPITGVLYHPSFAANLLSVHRLIADHGLTVSFGSTEAKIWKTVEGKNVLIMNVPKIKRLYVWKTRNEKQNTEKASQEQTQTTREF